MDIKRNIFKALEEDLFDRSATILVGARQVGKTFLLKALQKFAETKGLSTAFFDLEQPDDLVKFKGDESEIIKLISGAGDVVFIDEFHYLKNASRIFKAIYDAGKKVKIYASGSSSIEMHKHLKESLVGRKFVYKIFPCSVAEIMQAVSENTFAYYCKFGGMPGLVHIADEGKKKMLLSDILQSYLLKDIKALIREENVRQFNNLLYLLAQYQGSIVAVSNLANEVGMSQRTIESYLEMMNQTYTCFSLHSFSTNMGNELKKSKKYYLYDLGIRNALLKNFADLSERDDAGHIVESFVFGELQKRLGPETELRFWRLKTGEEVDFVWIKNQKFYPIEVKTACAVGDVPDGIRAFIKKYPKTKIAFVLNRQSEGEARLNSANVVYMKWENAFDIPSKIE